MEKRNKNTHTVHIISVIKSQTYLQQNVLEVVHVHPLPLPPPAQLQHLHLQRGARSLHGCQIQVSGLEGGLQLLKAEFTSIPNGKSIWSLVKTHKQILGHSNTV